MIWKLQQRTELKESIVVIVKIVRRADKEASAGIVSQWKFKNHRLWKELMEKFQCKLIFCWLREIKHNVLLLIQGLTDCHWWEIKNVRFKYIVHHQLIRQLQIYSWVDKSLTMILLHQEIIKELLLKVRQGSRKEEVLQVGIQVKEIPKLRIDKDHSVMVFWEEVNLLFRLLKIKSQAEVTLLNNREKSLLIIDLWLLQDLDKVLLRKHSKVIVNLKRIF